MSVEENKATFRRFVEDVLGSGQVDALQDLVADDFEDHGSMPGQQPGRAGLATKVHAIREAFPDLTAKVLMMIGEDNLVVGQVALSGTHQGALMGISPTNRSIDVTEFHMWRFVDGKGVEHWELSDKLVLLGQLGFELTPPRPPSNE